MGPLVGGPGDFLEERLAKLSWGALVSTCQQEFPAISPNPCHEPQGYREIRRGNLVTS